MSKFGDVGGRRARACLCVLSVPVVLMVSGCATRHSPDPLESWNRDVFAFNDSVDVHVLKPLAEGYVKVTPDPVRTGVRNFFGNISDVWTSVNLFLQGRFKDGAASTMRVMVNSTLGLGGLIDLSTPMRLDRYREDLGQTLGVWGMPSGPYLVWPIMGPSTVRDSASIVGDTYFSATTLFDGAREDNLVRLLNGVSTRAAYLSATDLVDQVALDKYAFTRDAYLQRRQSLIDEGQSSHNEDAEEDEAPQPRYDLPEAEAEADAGAAAAPASAASAP
ncbi:MAG: VacJ family lipoprotein [Aquabacterium sp.]|jgi:phospholipid-binding lipoprotein MlaA|nr:VacJ family lipoprotein [Aquabacterium sp.]